MVISRQLSIGAADYAAMLDLLQAVYPEEGCGLLAGRKGQVTGLYPVENRLHSSIAYEMEPRQQLQAMQAIDEAGHELLAIYHSHPYGPESPSMDDVARAHYPDAVYIIVSLALPGAPVVRAFTIRGGRIAEIVLKIA